jgi:hypothetical protein
MQPIDNFHANYLDVLADATAVSSVINSGSDVFAIVTLAELLLRPGSNIDVYLDGLFWEAEIIAVKLDRFRFRFVHATGKSFSGGWVCRRDFLISWRFPVRVESDVWKAHLIADFMSNQD